MILFFPLCKLNFKGGVSYVLHLYYLNMRARARACLCVCMYVIGGFNEGKEVLER